MRLIDRVPDEDVCRCMIDVVERPDARNRHRTELQVDADDCPGRGDLVDSRGCRAAVIDVLAERDASVVRTRAGGYERTYTGGAAGFLLAAGRFVEEVAFHDEALAVRARADPLAAVREATGRAGPVARLAAESGLALGTERGVDRGAERAVEDGGYARVLRPFVGPTMAKSRLDRRPPPGARLLDQRDLPGGSTARIYGTERGRVYHLTPVEHELDPGAVETLDAAYGLLIEGAVSGGERAPGRAIRRVATAETPVRRLTAVLRKHTRGQGVLDDLLADERLSDVSASTPVDRNPLRVTLDGQRLRSNVRLTSEGAAALASRLRRTSGRGFSRASPTVDATIDVGGERVRVAGVTAPASDGLGFAFRRHDEQPWTLPALVANETLTAAAGALLSVAVERGAAVLFAGPRGAGKTTLLAASLWELPPAERTVTIEDTPELPIGALQAADRDVQPLRTASGDGPAPTPAEALRTALRLGDGALVVGEVRGAEARVLYEAMRVGSGDGAILGTIHGSGGEAVRERVVTDLGVPESSFAATDLIVTAGADPHRVTRIEELRTTADGVSFDPLYAETDGGLVSTNVIARGNSHVVADLAGADGSYAAVRDAIAARTNQLQSDSVDGRSLEATAGHERRESTPARRETRD